MWCIGREDVRCYCPSGQCAASRLSSSRLEASFPISPASKGFRREPICASSAVRLLLSRPPIATPQCAMRSPLACCAGSKCGSLTRCGLPAVVRCPAKEEQTRRARRHPFANEALPLLRPSANTESIKWSVLPTAQRFPSRFSAGLLTRAPGCSGCPGLRSTHAITDGLRHQHLSSSEGADSSGHSSVPPCSSERDNTLQSPQGWSTPQGCQEAWWLHTPAPAALAPDVQQGGLGW